MSSSIAEVARLVHLDIEVQTHAAALDMAHQPSQSRGRIIRDQRVAARLSQLKSDFTRLSYFYTDTDGAHKAAIDDAARADTLQPFLVRARALLQSQSAGEKAMISATQDGALSSAALSTAAAIAADTEEAAAAAAAAAAAPAPALPSELAFAAGEFGGLMVDLQEQHSLFMELPMVKARISAAAAAAASGSTGAPTAAGIAAVASTMDTYQFLTLIDSLPTALPLALKLSQPPSGAAAYEVFLRSLTRALGEFHARWRPLAPGVSTLEQAMEEEFAELWDSKELEGWFPSSEAAEKGKERIGAPARTFETSQAVLRVLHGPSAAAAPAGMNDDDSAPAAATAAVAGVDDLESNPLFCRACDKLFPKQTVFDSHLTGKKHAKAAAKLAESGAGAGTDSAAPAAAAAAPGGRSEWARRVALLELQAISWCGLLRPVLDATLTYLDKRRTATPDELAAAATAAAATATGVAAEGEGAAAAAAAAAASELACAVVLGVSDNLSDLAAPSSAAAGAGGAGDDDGDDDEASYNPLNLPLDWDGNPIPFWLYKLHQLNLRFTCEVCGGEEYRGTRNFYKHFREWKHTYFLKCLGIPNSEHFVNIPLVADALALHARLQHEAAGAAFEAAEGEEVEDALGNVYSKGAYEELKSKGLVS